MKHKVKSVKPLIGKSSALFLDRDGVINRRVVGNYVRKPQEFELLPGVGEAIAAFNKIFDKIIIVTNQQGVKRGLMTEKDLHEVHDYMLKLIEEKGGRIDRIFYCTELSENNSFFRKPNVGMALAARREFPSIRLSKSIMVGDSVSDMQFGKRLKMKTVFISDSFVSACSNHKLIDYNFTGLDEFCDFVKY